MAPTEPLMKQMQFINSDHIGDFCMVGAHKIHYYEQGEGEPLLLLHGLGQSLFTWNKVISSLARNFRVLAVDLPGGGYSRCAEGMDYSVQGIADVLAGFMDAMNIYSAHFCAFSTGSYVALAFAQQYMQRVGRLALICPGGITRKMPLILRAVKAGFSTVATLMLNHNTIEKALKSCYFDTTMVNRHMVRGYLEPLCNAAQRRACISAVKAFSTKLVDEQLRNIQNEVLVFWGVDSKWRDLNDAQLYHMALKRMQFTLMRNCGHIVQEEKAAKFAQELLDYLHDGLELPPIEQPQPAQQQHTQQETPKKSQVQALPVMQPQAERAQPLPRAIEQDLPFDDFDIECEPDIV